MLNYEEFAEAFKEGLSAKLGEMPEKGELQFLKKAKINCEVDGITFRKDGSEIAPCIYIQNYYEMYERVGNLDVVVGEAAKLLYEQRNGLGITTPKLEPGQFDGRIIFQLINTERNKSLLEDMPHRELEDLSIIYRAFVGNREDIIGSIMITDSIAESLKLTEEDLYAQAYENTREIMKPSVKTMEEVLCKIMGASPIADDLIDRETGMFKEESGLYVISNNNGIMGASSILYDDVLQSLADKLDDNLVVLPSSLHEVIALRAGGNTLDNLKSIVHEVNTTQVAVTDLLSDNIYVYDKDARTLTMATSDRDLHREAPEHKHSGR